MYDREVQWVGSSLDDLRAFPVDVRKDIGYALEFAQDGLTHQDAKPLKGFHGAGVLEIIERHDGDTYRAVYTVRLQKAVYVLHCFQKKSPRGAAIPRHDADLIHKRLADAERRDKDDP